MISNSNNGNGAASTAGVPTDSFALMLSKLEAVEAQLQASKKQKEKESAHGTIRVGQSFGFLSSLLQKRTGNEVSTNMKMAFYVGTGYVFKSALGEMSREQSSTFINQLAKNISLAGSVLEVRVVLSYEEISQICEAMLEGSDGIPYSYASFEVSLQGMIEGKKRLVKDAEGNEETRYTLQAGVCRFVEGTLTPANNPFADDSVLATPEELEAGMLAEAQRSRDGFNSWRDARRDVGQLTKAPEGVTPSIPNTADALNALIS